MKINTELANEIAKRAMAIIHHNVNIIDNNGVIIASGNRQRIGQKHGAAIEAIKTNARITINNDDEAARFENTNLGINHPIVIGNEVAIVVGISGDPAVIYRYSELAILTAELLLKQANDIRSSNWKKRLNDSLLSDYIEYGDTERGQLALGKISESSDMLSIETVPVIIRTDHQSLLMADVIECLLNKLTTLLDADRIILLSHCEVLLLLPSHLSVSSVIEKATYIVSSQLSSFKVGVGIAANGPCDIRDSIIFSRAVIDTGTKVDSTNRVYHFKNMAVLCILKEIESSYLKSFFSKITDKLVSHAQGEQIIETLDQFINNNAEMGKTAAQLGIHRNTLSYRLSSVKK